MREYIHTYNIYISHEKKKIEQYNKQNHAKMFGNLYWEITKMCTRH